MKRLKIILMSVLVLLTPVFVQADDATSANTLATNEQVPNKLIENLLGDELGQNLMDQPYLGFYQIDGKVRSNKIHFEKVKDKYSYPDESLEPLAVSLMSLIQIPVYSTGTRIKTRATAYVTMFDASPSELGMASEDAVYLPTSSDGDPNTTVLVIIKQKETSNAKNPNMRLANAELGKRDGNQAYFFQLTI